MITKCDHPGCTKAGTCRAPKNRDLREYWHFCQKHAAEYNKNWNYYANMTPQEIEEDWERQTFGAPLKDTKTANANEAEYVQFLNDFIRALDLPITATWREVGAKYRALAKKHHPDTAENKESATTEFTKITNAYNTLRQYFNK